MPNVGCCLTRLAARNDGMRVDQSERVNEDLAFDRLDRINDNSNGSWSKGFEGLKTSLSSWLHHEQKAKPVGC